MQELLTVPEIPLLSPRRSWVSALVALVLVELVLRWVLVIFGGSFLVDALVICGAGLAFLVVGWSWLSNGSRRNKPQVFAGGAVMLTGVMAFWTYHSSIPVPSAAATRAAQGFLDNAKIGPKTGAPCLTIKTGNIGPLSAPIYSCAFPDGAHGGVVKYSSSPLGNEGIAYHPGSIATLSLYDDCVRSIGGNWWLYQRASPDCPLHYQLISGP